MDLWDIEVEPEVRAWLESLPKRQFGHVLAFAEKLAEEAATLSEPYSRHLGGKVRELRIPVFRKTRAQETTEFSHGHAEVVFDREA